MSNNSGITDLWLAIDKTTIQYVAVDLETKHVPKENFTGALVGVGPISGLTDLAKPESVFIWIATGANFERLEILNSEDYEVTLIHVGALQDKEPVQISSGASASDNLERCLLILESIGKTQKTLLDGDSGLLDATKFTDWALAIKERIGKDRSGKIESKSTEKKSDTSYSRNGALITGSEDHSYTCGYQGYHASVARKVTTKSFKRSSRYPIGAALDAMKKKVDKIRSKAYAPLNPFDVVENKDQKAETSLGVSVGDHVRIVVGQWANWEGRLISINKDRTVTIEMPRGTKLDMDEAWVIAVSAPAEEKAAVNAVVDESDFDFGMQKQPPIDVYYG